MAYPRILLILLENRMLRGKEGNSLLVQAPITLLLPRLTFLASLLFYTLHFLSYSYVLPFLPYAFLFLFFLAILLTCLSLLFLIASPSFRCCLHCAQLRPFYTTCHDKF